MKVIPFSGDERYLSLAVDTGTYPTDRLKQTNPLPVSRCLGSDRTRLSSAERFAEGRLKFHVCTFDLVGRYGFCLMILQKKL
jgi:hypothetical protein